MRGKVTVLIHITLIPRQNRNLPVRTGFNRIEPVWGITAFNRAGFWIVINGTVYVLN